MNNSDTNICYGRLSCCLQEDLSHRDATKMSSPDPKVFDYSWELECQQRDNKEKSKVNGTHHVHQSLRHVGLRLFSVDGCRVINTDSLVHS